LRVSALLERWLKQVLRLLAAGQDASSLTVGLIGRIIDLDAENGVDRMNVVSFSITNRVSDEPNLLTMADLELSQRVLRLLLRLLLESLSKAS
jgi:hypothetical protein